jgi:hypothetical protein
VKPMTHEQAIGALATERYLLEEMTETERDDFEAHYFSCAACADDVRLGAVLREGVRSTPSERSAAAGRVVSFKPRAWYLSTALPWAVAATLAVAVGYQSLVGLPSARQGSETLVLSPITLRPASRGQEPVLTIARGTSRITLAIDVGSPANGDLSYDIQAPNGRQVVSGRAPVPSSGSPLLLLVPAAAVAAPGEYLLSVKASASSEPADEYSFKIAAP